MTLTKADIARTISEQNGYPQVKSAELVENLLEIIKRNLESGGDVLISGFGRFCVKQKRERIARNLATGEEMMLAPRRVVTFKWSKMLRDKING